MHKMTERHIYHNAEHHKHKGWIDDEGQPWDVPERVYGIVTELLADTIPTEWIVVPELHPETIEIVSRVHSPDMMQAIYEAGLQATADIPVKSAYDRDKFTNASAVYPGTYEQALFSAEAILAATDGLLGDEEKRLTIALSRPPGHHAGREFYHGFCFINNAAIAAQAMKDAGNRVAILDIDVHHGDGIQDIFEDESEVLYVSLHADPDQLEPHTGYAIETGVGAGEGTILNLPFPIGVSNDDYFGLLERAKEKIKSFGADYLIIEAGFDGHAREWPDLPPLTNLDNPEYAQVGNLLGAMDMRTLIIMGGGYNHDVTPKAFAGFVKGFEEGAKLREADVYTAVSVLPDAE
ncbi:hypothetical protein H7200_00180 [Candidatus Saccharibacteria bacterium]|nr:hypothetical protein [Candidatus Saccharibacteria bacterium]